MYFSPKKLGISNVPSRLCPLFLVCITSPISYKFAGLTYLSVLQQVFSADWGTPGVIEGKTEFKALGVLLGKISSIQVRHSFTISKSKKCD